MKTLFFFFFALTMMYCAPKKGFEVKIEKRLKLDSIPGGSGMVVYKDTVYVIGDNSSYLFRLNKHYEIIEKTLLFPEYKNTSIIEKAVKPDLESIAIERGPEGDFLYAFGSGSLSPQRDVVVQIRVGEERSSSTIVEIGTLYARITKIAGFSRADLNIEGAVIFKNDLYLFNRGTNEIIRLPMRGFKDYLNNKKPAEEVEIAVFPLELPQIEGKKAGFSGASIILESDKIIFTATVEDTENWIADGEVLGSYVGILDLEKLTDGKLENVTQVLENGHSIVDKLEAIVVRSQESNGDLLALSVADNDDGTSVLFELRIRGLKP